MRGAADTPGRRAARSRIRGLALAIGGVCAAATGPDIMAQRQALFFLPWRVFAGDIPGLKIGRFRTPPEPPSESPSGSPSPPPALGVPRHGRRPKRRNPPRPGQTPAHGASRPASGAKGSCFSRLRRRLAETSEAPAATEAAARSGGGDGSGDCTADCAAGGCLPPASSA